MVATTRSQSQESMAGKEEMAEFRNEILSMKEDIAELKKRQPEFAKMKMMMTQMWTKMMGADVAGTATRSADPGMISLQPQGIAHMGNTGGTSAALKGVQVIPPISMMAASIEANAALGMRKPELQFMIDANTARPESYPKFLDTNRMPVPPVEYPSANVKWNE